MRAIQDGGLPPQPSVLGQWLCGAASAEQQSGCDGRSDIFVDDEAEACGEDDETETTENTKMDSGDMNGDKQDEMETVDGRREDSLARPQEAPLGLHIRVSLPILPHACTDGSDGSSNLDDGDSGASLGVRCMRRLRIVRLGQTKVEK